MSPQPRGRMDVFYPCADDAATGAGLVPAEDAVVTTLTVARERYREGASSATYVGTEKGKIVVCAIGAVAAAQGWDQRRWTMAQNHVRDESYALWDQYDKIYYGKGPRPLDAVSLIVMRDFAEPARRAIELLNRAALELAPWIEEAGGGWDNPLERLNQEYSPGDIKNGIHDDEAEDSDFVGSVRYKRVLAAYDRAIELRQEQLHAVRV